MTTIKIAPDRTERQLNAALSEASPYGRLTHTPHGGGLSRDKLFMTPRGQAARVASLALDQMQREVPELMVAGVSLLFAAIMSRCNLPPDEMHKMGMRMLRNQEGMRGDNDLLQSLKDFAGVRILGDRNVGIS